MFSGCAKKIITLVLLVAIDALSGHGVSYGMAVPANPDTMRTGLILPADAVQLPGRKKVGVVLSGGGAKGVAHIGVLKVLEEADIPIDYIAGTSMGAIIGGLYAIGWSTAELDSLVRNQDWLSLLSDRIPRRNQLLSEREISDQYLLSVPLSLDKKFSLPSGVLAGQSVLNLLNEMTLGYHDTSLDFDSLPIPFACVAYDMVKGEEVVMRHGNLPTAIRASMAIPGAFAPVVQDNMLLVDGGIYNNFPVDVARDMGADIVIGVDLASGPQDLESLNSMMGLISQITTFLGREKYSQNIELVNLRMNPDVHPYNSGSFTPEAVDSLLVRGERCAREHWDELIALREKIHDNGHPVIHRQRILANETDLLRIGEIRFIGLTPNEETFIRPSLGIKENTVITKSRLNTAISKIRGSGAFSYVTYTLESEPPYTLLVSVNEKQAAMINAGFRFDSEEMAGILLHTSLSFRGLQGPALKLTVRLNENPYIKLDLNSSNILSRRLGLTYMFKSNSYQLYKNGTGINNISFDQNLVDLHFSQANPRIFSPVAGISYEHYNYTSFLYASEADHIAVKPEGFVNYYISGSVETLNDPYFPQNGVSAQARVALHTDNGYGYNGGTPFASAAYHIRWAVSTSSRLTFLPTVYGRTLIGNEVAYSYYNYIGGQIAGRYMPQQIPFVGIRHMETADRSLLTVGLEIRMRFFARNFISLLGAYGIQDANFFRMFTMPNRFGGIGVKYAYNSPIGPISLLLDISTVDKSMGVYFSLGKTF